MISKYAAYLLDVEPTRRRRRPRRARLDGADLSQLEIPQGAAQSGGRLGLGSALGLGLGLGSKG